MLSIWTALGVVPALATLLFRPYTSYTLIGAVNLLILIAETGGSIRARLRQRSAS